tara:strand:- start:129 stop:530 length:402 start_codon:yes stop_codon:yes gene_type:complete
MNNQNTLDDNACLKQDITLLRQKVNLIMEENDILKKKNKDLIQEIYTLKYFDMSITEALEEFIQLINENPQYTYYYDDEDKAYTIYHNDYQKGILKDKHLYILGTKSYAAGCVPSSTYDIRGMNYKLILELLT